MSGIMLHRPARTYPDALPQDEIAVAPPPLVQATPRSAGSWLQFLLPVVGSLSSVLLLSFGRGAGGMNPALIGGSVLMVVLSLSSGILIRRQMMKSGSKQKAGDKDKYLRYLAQQSARLDGIVQRQRAANSRLYPKLAELTQVVNQREVVWERRPTDDDFMDVRIGESATPLSCKVRLDLDANPLAEHDPMLVPLAQSMISKYDQIPDAPVVIPLRGTRAMAITGRLAQTRALARSMVCALAAFHAPDDLRIMAYFPAQATAEWSWLRWLPHTRRLHQPKGLRKDAPEPLCLLADTPADFAMLLSDQVIPELERQRRIAETKGAGGGSGHAPALQRFLIIVDSFSPESPLARMPELESLMRDETDLGVTVINLVESRRMEPSILQARIDITDIGLLSYEETKPSGRRIEAVHPDAADVPSCERIARALAPLIVGEHGIQQDLSVDMPLLSLLGIQAPELVDTSVTWRPRSRADLLNVPIGIRADGQPLMLDIKEAADGGQGVHGLVIGATGSGKSELLRSLVTSLAITHDPETLNFVFADFKGGAAFADLARLPHAAGMISNLQDDLSLVDRMRAALFGEQERRQRMLREAGNLDNIKQFHAKRTTTNTLEPMPYLLIVIDEFAELLSNRPDFLELFVAIGRIGRSIGMHLLLATQRLGEGRIQGLEGHLRYRICLRTFGASESSMVIGTPDAFYLPSYPGVGYFKVDTDVYEMFKSALISTTYVPMSAKKGPSIRVREFTATGKLKPIEDPSRSNGPSVVVPGDQLQTDMDVVINKLAEAGRQGDYRVHQVWLPPLDPNLTLDKVLAQTDFPALNGSSWPSPPPFGPLRVPVGVLDKPAEQRQEPLVLDFSGSGGHLVLVGAPQSGKSTFLRGLINGLTVTHTPRDVQIYCLDFGGGLLRTFEGA
ncbi:MAG TPA: type VII secretion protein EccCa, partial [Ktedonobacterales bacterium]|nr:type VII secretion protein EccCa [Ktedonobacterales bacterium]